MTTTEPTLTALLDEAANSDIDDFLGIAEEALHFGHITTTSGETVWTATDEALTYSELVDTVRDAVLSSLESLQDNEAAIADDDDTDPEFIAARDLTETVHRFAANHNLFVR